MDWWNTPSCLPLFGTIFFGVLVVEELFKAVGAKLWSFNIYPSLI
jgi:hypothetical protein